MGTDDTQTHIDHLRWEQDHLQWSADHLRALSVLRRLEAHLYAHEAHTMLHRAEIARHDETLSHGKAHLPIPRRASTKPWALSMPTNLATTPS